MNKMRNRVILSLTLMLLTAALCSSAAFAATIKGTVEGVVGGKTVTFRTQQLEASPNTSAYYDGVEYVKFKDNDYYKIYRYPTDRETLVLADSIGGYPVTDANSLGNFGDKLALRHLTLGVNMKEIPHRFAVDQPYLEEVTIPEGSALQRIESDAFAGCKTLTRVGVGNTDKLPANLKAILSYAFQGSGIRSVDMSGLTDVQVREAAFIRCASLTSVKLPPSIEAVEAVVFKGCTALEEITIPANVKAIFFKAFTDCSNLRSITIEGAPLPGLGFNRPMERCFGRIAPDATIYVPRPADQKAYDTLMSQIYHYSNGSAPASAKVRWIDAPTRGKQAPTVSLDPGCLEDLAAVEGVTVDPQNAAAIGCEAIVTVTGAAKGAQLKAVGSGQLVYWDYEQPYKNGYGLDIQTKEPLTGAALTESMKGSALWDTVNQPAADLSRNLTYPKYGLYYYYPISTNPGGPGIPGTSAVGKPVLVIYLPDEVFMPQIENEISTPSNFYGKDWGEELSFSSGVIVKGFENLFDHKLTPYDAAYVDDNTYMTYQWYHSTDEVLGNADDIPVDTEEYMLYMGYERSGTTDGFLWKASMVPAEYRKNLSPGIHTLYPKITLSINGNKTSALGRSYIFYRYDRAVLAQALRLEISGDAAFQSSTEWINYYTADYDADVTASVNWDFTGLPEGYRQFERFVDSVYFSQVPYDADEYVNHDFHQEDTKGWIQADTQRLEETYVPNSQPNGLNDALEITAIVRMKIGDRKYPHSEEFTSGKYHGVEEGCFKKVFLRGTGKRAEPQLEFFRPWYDDNRDIQTTGKWIFLYVQDPTADWTTEIQNGRFLIYRVSSPEQNRGGTLVMDISGDHSDIRTSWTTERLMLPAQPLQSSTPGPAYYYCVYENAAGNRDYSHTFIRYKPWNDGRYKAVPAMPNAEKLYVAEGGGISTCLMDVSITDFLPSTALECSSTDSSTAAWRELDPSDTALQGHVRCSTIRNNTRVAGDVLFSDRTYEAGMDYDAVQLLRSRLNSSKLYLRVRFDGPNGAVSYSEPVEFAVSSQTVEMPMTVYRNGNVLKNRPVLISQGDMYPAQLTTRVAKGEGQTIKWEVRVNNQVLYVLSEEHPRMLFDKYGETEQYIEAVYRPAYKASDLKFPIPQTGNSVTYTATAIATGADGTSGGRSETITVVTNRRENAEQPGAYLRSGYIVSVMTGETEKLPEIKVGASASDGGSLTWQWYRCADKDKNGAVAIPGAKGAGKDAIWQLKPEDVVEDKTIYCYCEVTNHNPQATNKKTAVKKSDVCTIRVSSNLCRVEVPRIEPFAATEYEYTESYNVPAEPFTIKVKKPAPLTGVMGGADPTVYQKRVVLDTEIYNLTGKHPESGTTYYFNEGRSNNSIQRTESGDFYIYTIDPGFALSKWKTSPDKLRITLQWTVFNTLADDSTPENLATDGRTAVVNSLPVVMTRSALPAPSFETDSNGHAVMLKESLSTQIHEVTEGGVTFRVYEQYQGKSDDQSALRPFELRIRPSSFPNQSDLKHRMWVEAFDPATGTWDIAWEHGVGEGLNTLTVPDTVTGDRLLRIRLWDERQTDTGSAMALSPNVYSEPFGIRVIKDADNPEHVQLPAAPADYPTEAVWIVDSGAQNTSSLTLGASGWTAADSGTLSYEWEWRDGEYNWHPIRKGDPGVTFLDGGQRISLDGSSDPMQYYLSLYGTTGESVSGMFRMEAANMRPEVSGVWRKTAEQDISLTVDNAAAIPQVSISADASQYRISQDASPVITSVIANSSECVNLTCEWFYQVAELDGSPVSCDWIKYEWGVPADPVTVHEWGELLKFNETDSEWLNTDFWNVHDSVKLLWKCVATNQDTEAHGQWTSIGESAPIAVTILRPKTPTVTGVELEAHSVNQFTDPTPPAAVSTTAVQGFEQGIGDYSYRKNIRVTAELQDAGSWTEENLCVNWEYWDGGKWVNDGYGSYEQNRNKTFSAALGKTLYVRALVYGDYGEASSRRVSSPVIAIRGVEPVSAQSPRFVQKESDFDWNTGVDTQITLGKNAWELDLAEPGAGTLSYRWSYRLSNAEDMKPIVPDGKDILMDPATGALTLKENAAMIKDAISRSRTESGVMLTLEQTAANTYPEATGSTMAESTKFMYVNFGKNAETPAVSITPDTVPAFRCGQEEAPVLTASVSNEAACKALSYQAYYQITEIDGKPVTGVPQPLSDSKTASVGAYGSSLHDGKNSYYLNKDSFWKKHSELKLKLWFQVTNTDNTATGLQTMTGESSAVTITVKKPQAPAASPLTAVSYHPDKTEYQKLTDPAVLIVPKGGEAKLSVPAGEGLRYWWEWSTDGTDFSSFGDDDTSPVLTRSDWNEYYPYVRCCVQSVSADGKTVYAETNSAAVRLNSLNVEAAAKPDLTACLSYVWADPGETISLQSKAVSPDGGVLTYVWYQRSGTSWTLLMGKNSADISVTAASSAGAEQEYKVVVTNFNDLCKVKTATAETTITVTARGAAIVLPDPIPAGVAGAPYEMEFQAKLWGKKCGEITFAPITGYTIEPGTKSGSYVLRSASATALTGAVIQAEAELDGKTVAFQSDPFKISLQDMAIQPPELLIPTVESAEPQLLGTLTALGGTGKLTWSVTGPEWITVDPDTGELTAKTTPMLPGWFDVTVTVTDGGGHSDTRTVSVGVKGKLSTSWLAVYDTDGQQNVLYPDEMKIGPGWSWDGRINLLTLNGASLSRIGGFNLSEHYIRLVGDSTVHYSFDDWDRALSASKLYLMADSPATLTVKQTGPAANHYAVTNVKAIYLNPNVTLKVESIGTDKAGCFDYGVALSGAGRLQARAISSGGEAVAFQSGLTVTDSAEADILAQGTRAVGLNSALTTRGTGNVTIHAEGSEEAKAIIARTESCDIGHTGGTVKLMVTAPAGSGSMAIDGGVVVSNAVAYEVTGKPESSLVSYRTMSAADAPTLYPAEDVELNLVANQAMGNVKFEASAAGTITWKAENLPAGLSFTPAADGKSAVLNGAPTEPGTKIVVISVTANGKTTSKTVKIHVSDTVIGVMDTRSQDEILEYTGGILYAAKRPDPVEVMLLEEGTVPASYEFAYSAGSKVKAEMKATHFFLDLSACPVGETGTVTLIGRDGTKAELGRLEIPYVVCPESGLRSLSIDFRNIEDNLMSADYAGKGWKWDHTTCRLLLEDFSGWNWDIYGGGNFHVVYSGVNTLDGACISTTDRDKYDVTLEGKPGAVLNLIRGDASSDISALYNMKSVTFSGGNIRVDHNLLTRWDFTGVVLRDVESAAMQLQNSLEGQTVTVDNTDKTRVYAQYGSLESGAYAYAGQTYPDFLLRQLPETAGVTEGQTVTFTVEAPVYTATDGTVLKPKYQWYLKGAAVSGETSAEYTLSASDVGAVGDTAECWCRVSYPAHEKISSTVFQSAVCTVTVASRASFTDSITVDGDTTSFTLRDEVHEIGTFIAAAYDKEGRCIGTAFHSVTADSAGRTVTISTPGFGGAASVRVFFLDELWKPLYPAISEPPPAA